MSLDSPHLTQVGIVSEYNLYEHKSGINMHSVISVRKYLIISIKHSFSVISVRKYLIISIQIAFIMYEMLRLYMHQHSVAY